MILKSLLFRLVSGSRDRRLILWDLTTGSRIRNFDGHETIVNDVKFDGAKIVSGDEAGCVKVWDVVTIHLNFHNKGSHFL